MKVIFLIMIGLSSLSFAEFSRDGDIVTDSISKLQWQDNAISDTMKWRNAIDYCEKTLTLGGYDDWRLPNINELKSIIDKNKYNPAIVNGFENTSPNRYWSSTTSKRNSEDVWIVDFYNGYSFDFSNYAKDDSCVVRCVRTGDLSENEKAVVSKHNAIRAELYSGSDMVWSESLANLSQAYANELAQRGILKKRGQVNEIVSSPML